MSPAILLVNPLRNKRSPITSSEQPICQICKKQVSKYTCPACNLHYCCLSCFRSDEHLNCSETFDKNCLKEEIKGEERETARNAMEEILRKFEEESLQEGEEEDDFDQDLDGMTEEEMLSMLTEEQRLEFGITIQDSNKATALITEEFVQSVPWWELEEDLEEEEIHEKSRSVPEIIKESLLPPLRRDELGNPLVNSGMIYNTVATLFAYAYTIRTLSQSSLNGEETDPAAALAMFQQLLPFLVEKSTVMLSDISEGIEYVISREKADAIAPEFLALLLDDVATLFTPIGISTISSTNSLDSHSYATTLRALSDIHCLYSNSRSPQSSIIKRATSKAHSATAQKLLFYLTVIRASDSEMLKKIAHRLAEESKKRVLESVERSTGRDAVQRIDLNEAVKIDPVKNVAKIVEIE